MNSRNRKWPLMTLDCKNYSAWPEQADKRQAKAKSNK